MMIEKIDPMDYRIVLEYIVRNNLKISPYIPINLTHYSKGDANYSLYCIRDRYGYHMIASVYYNSIQLWVDGLIDFVELNQFINSHSIDVLYAPSYIIEKIGLNCTKEGYILDLENINNVAISKNVHVSKVLNDKEYGDIAKLIVEDPDLGSHSSIEETKVRYIKRNSSGFGRSYVAYCNNRIVAHVATHAESDCDAVIGGVVVHPDFRGKRIATTLLKVLCEDLMCEGKKIYLIVFNEAAISLYKKIGFREYCTWAVCNRYSPRYGVNLCMSFRLSR